MAKYVVKIERRGGQVRVTMPKAIVDETSFSGAAYGLMWVTSDKCVLIRPFIDGVLLREAVQGDRT